MIKVAIIGATGYTAVESIDILLRHEQVRITYLTALPQECGHIMEIFPVLKGRLDLVVEPVNLNKLSELADLALCCLPHRVSMQFVPRLLATGVKVVDFSADYRIHDAALYEQVYQVEHTDKENLSRAAFGLPELFRETIPHADLVANPGCYPTAAALAIAPLVKENLIDPADIVVNAVSGASGAGRKAALAFHFPEMNENLFAYAVGAHRHMPEIEQIVTDFTQTPVQVLFQPHVVSMDRGIFESIYCRPTVDIAPEKLMQVYQSYYADEPFIRILNEPPRTKNVAHTNFCDIFPAVVKGKIVVFSSIDNLIKGAAGQAVQNMNLICQLPETMGLL